MLLSLLSQIKLELKLRNKQRASQTPPPKSNTLHSTHSQPTQINHQISHSMQFPIHSSSPRRATILNVSPSLVARRPTPKTPSRQSYCPDADRLLWRRIACFLGKTLRAGSDFYFWYEETWFQIMFSRGKETAACQCEGGCDKWCVDLVACLWKRELSEVRGERGTLGSCARITIVVSEFGRTKHSSFACTLFLLCSFCFSFQSDCIILSLVFHNAQGRESRIRSCHISTGSASRLLDQAFRLLSM